MWSRVMVIVGGSLDILWGVSHLIPTKSVVAGFGNLSKDNENIILMEWINEGLTLIFIGVLILLVTILRNEYRRTVRIVYLSSAVMLFAMAVLSLFTGFHVDFLPFKLCPVIFSVSGLFILQGVFIK